MTDIPKLADLIDKVRDRVRDPAKQQLVAAMAADAVRVSAIALTDPELAESEMRHLQAQALNLAAGEAAAVQVEVLTWVQSIVGTVVAGLLARV